MNEQLPIIGFSIGDINGIGPEIIIKTLSDNRIFEFCVPVIFGHSSVLNFYRKSLHDGHFNYTVIKDSTAIKAKQVNVYNCWDDEIKITPGEITPDGGKAAVLSLEMATQALKNGKIDGLVTAPLHKKNVQSAEFKYTGHTPFLKDSFGAKDVLMFLCADNMRVGLVTEHVSVQDINKHINREIILSKLNLMNNSLKNDFGISKPKIAILALNPHAGDDGLIGKEEIDVITPTLKEAQKNILCYGPYSSDAFFARGMHEKFDGVLAMYHDQGLIPFKSLAFGDGVNFTAGLSAIRTSPDHGTAFDIAGKNKADESSTREALYMAIDILKNRREIAFQKSNPMKKMGARVMGRAADERITEDS